MHYFVFKYLSKLTNNTYMQKVTLFLLIIAMFLSVCSFNNAGKEKIQWLTVAEMQIAFSKSPRPILIDVYTSWCGWCKVMDKETYRNNKVVNYINEHFYAVKLDAEDKDAFIWLGEKYDYNPQYKANSLAVYLLDGQMSFPTTVFLTDLKAQPAPLAGYLKPVEIEAPLKYFGGGAFKSTSFSEFSQSFKSSW
jgi:thioredoxin-related protein